jgi:hypothetical protein
VLHIRPVPRSDLIVLKGPECELLQSPQQQRNGMQRNPPAPLKLMQVGALSAVVLRFAIAVVPYHMSPLFPLFFLAIELLSSTARSHGFDDQVGTRNALKLTNTGW